MKNNALQEIMRTVEEDIKQPLEDLKTLIQPIQDAQDLFVGAVHDIKYAWENLQKAWVNIIIKLWYVCLDIANTYQLKLYIYI